MNDETINVDDIAIGPETPTKKNEFDKLSEEVSSTTIDSILNDEAIEDIEIPEPTQEEIEESLKSNLIDQYNLSEQDIAAVLDIIARLDKNEKVNVYKELPLSMKHLINTLCDANNITSDAIKHEFAIDLINNIRYDSNVSLQIDAFNKAMKDIDFEGNMMSEYIDSTRKYMEETVIQKAEELEAKDDPEATETAKKLRELSAMYTKSYTYDYIKEEFLKNRKMRNRTITDLNRFHKYCINFDRYMADHTPYRMRPMESCVERLMSCNMENVTEDDIKKFLIILCKYFDAKFYDNSEMDKALMYYTINNLSVIHFSKVSPLNDFEKQIVSNIKDFIDTIHDVEEQNKEK